MSTVSRSGVGVVRDAGRYLILSVMVLGVLVPFASIVMTALNPPESLVRGLSWPSVFSLESFARAWTQANFATLVGTSLVIVAFVVPLSAIVSISAAYALALLKVPGSRFLYRLFIFGLVLPLEVIVVPIYFNLRSVGLTDSLLGVILVESATLVPFGVFWMHASFASFPRELIEAAQLDGASNLGVLRRVLFPLSRPAITTMCVLYFMWSWNQFLLVLILISTPGNRTAPAGLGFFVSQHTTDLPSLCAATLIVITPIVIVYLIFQRSFIAGMLHGALKG